MITALLGLLSFVTYIFPNILFTSVLAHAHMCCSLSLSLPPICCSPAAYYSLWPTVPHHSCKITYSVAGKGPITAHIIGKRASFITVILGLAIARAITFAGHFPVCFSPSSITVLTDPSGFTKTFYKSPNTCIKDG